MELLSKLLKIVGWIFVLFIVSNIIAFFLGNNDFNDKIVVIPIKGPIFSADSDSIFLKSFSSETIIKQLEKLEEDSTVKGIILEIDSNGGTVLPSKEIADKVKEIEKPVVALVKGSAMSGAYWIASASDKIVADDLSLVGSVGVLGSFLQFKGLLDKYDVEYERIVGGEYKDMASPLKEFTDEEREIVQERVDKIHDYFLDEIQENRGLTFEQREEISDAKFFLGMEAKNLNLIDEIGGLDLAFNLTKELANITEAKMVRKEKESRFFNLFSKYSAFSSYNIGRGIGAEIMDVSSKYIEFLA